jgi:DtxR family Mn-dependent transcriptional regulator
MVEERPHRTLAELPVGETARMLRVSDKNPSLLRYLADIALQPGAAVTMVSRAPFDGPLTLRIGHAEFAVGPTLAAQVLVEAMPFAAPAEALGTANAEALGTANAEAAAPSLPTSRKSTVR